MTTLSVQELKEGMVLAADACAKGSVLLKAGVTLSAKQIMMLKSWGVTQVEISGGSASTVSQTRQVEIPPAVLAQAKEMVLAVFAHSNVDFPPVKALFDLAVQRRAIAILKNTKAAS